MKLENILEAFTDDSKLQVKSGRITSKFEKEYTDDFYCASKKLTSLEGCPDIIKGDFDCSSNELTSLEGCPSIIGGYFDCEDNNLTSLEGIHKHIKKIDQTIYASINPITSHVLGAFLIPGCKQLLIDNIQVQRIINKYLPKGRTGLIDCQNELIEAGFEDYAQI